MTKSLFGRVFEEIGSSTSDLLLKTKGKVKIQWGNKFIDLINDEGNVSYPKDQIQKLVENAITTQLENLKLELTELITTETKNRETQFTEINTKIDTEIANIDTNQSLLNNKILDLEQNVEQLNQRVEQLMQEIENLKTNSQ